MRTLAIDVCRIIVVGVAAVIAVVRISGVVIGIVIAIIVIATVVIAAVPGRISVVSPTVIKIGRAHV